MKPLITPLCSRDLKPNPKTLFGFKEVILPLHFTAAKESALAQAICLWLVSYLSTEHCLGWGFDGGEERMSCLSLATTTLAL